MYLLFSILLGVAARAEVGHDFEARTAEGLRRVFARLSDPFSGVPAERFARLAMSGDFTIGGRPLRAGEAFRLAIGGAAVLPDGEVTAHQMEIFARLAPHVHDFADFLTLAQAPGREPFVRTLVSDALVTAQLPRLRTWALSPHDWATVLSFWSPAVIDPRECARIVATFTSVRDLRIATTGVTRADLRDGLARAARRRCQTYLWRGAVAIRFP